MTPHCEFEQDLLDAVASRRWPARADARLRTHVEGCAICADVAEVALAFFEDREAARADDGVPHASAVWWRAQIRAREEAARVAARPIAVVQAVSTACVAVAAAAAAPAASTWIRELIAALGAAAWSSLPGEGGFAWILGAAAYTTLPLLAAAVGAVLAPVLVYFALDE